MLIRLLGAYFPKTLEGMMEGKIAAATPALMEYCRNFRRESGFLSSVGFI
jgi:hypothetical protein